MIESVTPDDPIIARPVVKVVDNISSSDEDEDSDVDSESR